MSSVQGSCKCPKCGGEMIYDFDCNTTEEVRTCFRCGFHQAWFLLCDETGRFKSDENGNLLGDYRESIGYGAAFARDKDGSGIFCNFKAPLTEEEQAEYAKGFQENGYEGYIVVYDPEIKTFKAVFGEIPEDYQDDEETRQEVSTV